MNEEVKSSSILDIEKQALSIIQKCKIIYKNYKKSYMTYFTFVDSGVKTVEMISNNLTTSNRSTLKNLVVRSKTLLSFMNAIEVKFNNAYNEFVNLDKKLISPNIVRKMEHIFDDMNDARGSFNGEIAKILNFNDYLEHENDLNELNTE